MKLFLLLSLLLFIFIAEGGASIFDQAWSTAKKDDLTVTTQKETEDNGGDGGGDGGGDNGDDKGDDHGGGDCENLEVCTKYSRCAELIFTGNECEGNCSQCIDTGSYGSCAYYRKEKGSNGDFTIQCYGDADIQQVPKCRSNVCDQYSTPENCLSVEYCVWLEEGDQCIGDFCGHCIYTSVSCEKHKECYDNTDSQKARIHRCSVDDVQHSSCNKQRPTCAKCGDLTYDDCVGLEGCAWVDVTDYYDDSHCPTECGYCKPTCEYGGNNTCADAKQYYECQKDYTDDSSGSGSDGTGETEDGEKDDPNNDGGSDKSVRQIYCQEDTPPDNIGRCFVKDYFVENSTRRCEELSYEECINAAATDNSGGCAFVVSNNCGRACGRCMSIGIACTDYKTCHESNSGEGSHTETYYCDFNDEPEARSCEQKYCTGEDAASCLGESEQCVWYQFKSLDYRCGWCSFVCDSCEKEKKRIGSAYSSSEFFNGGKYDAICEADDDKLIKDCYKCYGKKSECANAYCLDELKACNADKTCSDRAFKVMCMNFGEQDGSIFYEKLVKEDNSGKDGNNKAETETEGEQDGETTENDDNNGDGITDNEALLNFAKCMKNACFENTDQEITDEFNSQTTVQPVCSFGYAELNYDFQLCLDSTTIADLCKENYAKNFKDVISISSEAKVYWRYLDSGCQVFFESSRRMAVDTTQVDPEDVADPWDRITGSTETPSGVPASENCLSVEVSTTYPTQEAYKADKDKYASIDANAYKLRPGATVTVESWSIECCKEDDICQNMQGSSVAVSTLLAVIAAVGTLLFV